MIKVIASFRNSAGNDSVGEMWTETKSFDASAKIAEIYKWVQDRKKIQTGSKVDVTLNVDQSSMPLNGEIIKWEYKYEFK